MRHFRAATHVVAGAAISLTAASSLSTTTVAQSPAFRSNVNLVRFEVRAVDASGVPVTTLTVDDFDVFEDGRRQTITAFARVLPPADSTARPADVVAPDASSNVEPPTSARRILIFLDALAISPDLTGQARQMAHEFVERYRRPGDLFAVGSSGTTTALQEFTGDMRRVNAAIDRLHGEKGLSPTVAAITNIQQRSEQNPLPENVVLPADPLAARPGAGSLGDSARRLVSAIDYLSQLGDGSKAVVMVSEGGSFDLVSSAVNLIADSTSDTRALTRASVPIYTIDPQGLSSRAEETILATGAYSPTAGVRDEVDRAQRSLRRLAADSGGLAIVGTNDMRGGLARIARHLDSYYELGFESTNSKSDGKFRTLSVRVKKPGISANAKSGYTAPRPPDTSRRRVSLDQVMSDELNAARPGRAFPLWLSATPLRQVGKESAIALALEIGGEAFDGTANSEQMAVAAWLISDSGKVVAKDDFKRPARFSGAMADTVRSNGLRWLSRLTAPPGNYQLRVAVATDTGAHSGVWLDVSVPTAGDPARASGLIITSTSSMRTPTLRADPLLSNIMPAPPTPRRTFGPSDVVAGIFEVYGLGDALEAAATVTVADASGAQVRQVAAQVQRTATGAAAAFTLPLAGLPVGKYTLVGSVKGTETPRIPFTLQAEQAAAAR